MKKIMLFLMILLMVPVVGRAETVRINYVPNIAFAQAFVIKGEQWDQEAGLDIQLQKFPAAPFAVQAFLSGQLDVIYTVLSSVIALGEKGKDFRVIAGGSRNQLFLYSTPALARLKQQVGPVQAIKTFALENKRKPKVALFARGIMSDILFRKWVHEHPALNLNDFEIVNIAGQDQFSQAVLSGDYDLMSVFEPIISIAQSKGLAMDLFLSPEEYMKNHPVVVLATSQDYLAKNPETIKKLLMLQERATQFIKDNPARAAEHVYQYIGKDLLDRRLVDKIVVEAKDQFDTSLDAIEWPSRQIMDYMVDDQLLAKPIDLNRLFYRP